MEKGEGGGATRPRIAADAEAEKDRRTPVNLSEGGKEKKVYVEKEDSRKKGKIKGREDGDR